MKIIFYFFLYLHSLFSFQVIEAYSSLLDWKTWFKHDVYPLHSDKLQSVKLVQWAREHLPKNGVLKESEDGFVYLKVDDRYINQLFPLIPYSNFVKPAYFRRNDSPGAHISVIFERERRKIPRIKEIGRRYSFTIDTLSLVPPHKRLYAVLGVTSPELENLRMKYGLGALPQGHEFHITIAKKRVKKRF